MSLVQIKVKYEYYSEKRITPLYMNEEDILMTYDDFKSRILEDVPHLNKITSPQITIRDDSLAVDLSPMHFCHKITGVLSKDKTISIWAIEFNSPIVYPGKKRTTKILQKVFVIPAYALRLLYAKQGQMVLTNKQSLSLSSQTLSSTNDIQKSPPPRFPRPWKGTL